MCVWGGGGEGDLQACQSSSPQPCAELSHTTPHRIVIVQLLVLHHLLCLLLPVQGLFVSTLHGLLLVVHMWGGVCLL